MAQTANNTVAPLFGTPSVQAPAANQGAKTTQNNTQGQAQKEFVPAEYFLNPGMGMLLPAEDGTESVVGFIPLPKGLPLDTMEDTDGKTDAYAARNALKAHILNTKIVKDLKPGEVCYLMPLVHGQMTIQVLRRRDPNAAPVGPMPITQTLASIFG